MCPIFRQKTTCLLDEVYFFWYLDESTMEELLRQDIIDIGALKDLAFSGCPDSGSIRALCWRLILSALPPDRSEWDQNNKIQRDNYTTFVNEFIIRPETQKSVRSTDPLR